MSRYQEIEVAGLPRAMGRQIGEAAANASLVGAKTVRETQSAVRRER